MFEHINNIFSLRLQGFVTINGKSVNKADLLADNGIIHYVTDVVYPLVNRDIPAVLAKDGRFGTLLTAIEMAGLGDLLTQSRYTLFLTVVESLMLEIPEKFFYKISPALPFSMYIIMVRRKNALRNKITEKTELVYFFY